MRRLAVIATVIATATALPALALAADGPPSGKYTTKITAPAPLKGTWVMAIAQAKGTYAITQAGKIVVRGSFLSIGPQIQFYKETGPKACKTPGFYNWKRTGKKLTFSMLHDPKCGRAVVLAHTFKLTS